MNTYSRRSKFRDKLQNNGKNRVKRNRGKPREKYPKTDHVTQEEKAMKTKTEWKPPENTH